MYKNDISTTWNVRRTYKHSVIFKNYSYGWSNHCYHPIGLLSLLLLLLLIIIIFIFIIIIIIINNF